VPPPAPPEEVSKEDKNLGMLTNLLSILGFVPPLVIWLIKKGKSPFVEDQAKEALNWEIGITIGIVACAILSGFSYIGWIFGLSRIAIGVLNLVFCIKGAMAASNGVRFRYPWTLGLVK